MKNVCLLLISFAFIQGKAQEKDTLLVEEKNFQPEIYIKGNALFVPLAMLNVGVEYKLNHKYTLQGDVFVSPWKSYLGKHAQIYMSGIEGRYYFSEAFQKFYVGANFSFALYNIQKWNYWKDIEFIINEGDNEMKFNRRHYYQKGMAFIIGATLGYQMKWKENWNIDFYLGIGSSQGFYRGYDEVSGKRLDEINATKKRNWNRSGEWIPYRGGIMISYKIR